MSVFHNRRWDGDFLTVKKLIEQGQLGDVKVFESHFDRYRPVVRQRWREQAQEGGGILFDLAPPLTGSSPSVVWSSAVVIRRLPDDATRRHHPRLL